MRKLDSCQIIIDNKEISHFSYLNISQHFDWHHSYNIRVPISIIGNNFNNWLGKILKINIKEKNKDQEIENSFSGVIVKVGTSKESLENSEVILSGQSPTFLLESRTNCRSFTDKTLQGIVKEVVDAFPNNLLRPQIKPKTKQKIAYCVQYKESDYQFLRRLADFYGEWCFFNGSEFYFGDCPSKPESTLYLNRNLFSLDLSLKVEPTKFRLLAYNYRKAEQFSGDSSSATVSSSNTYSRTAISASNQLLNQESILPALWDIENKSELDEVIQNRKSALVNNLVVLSGNSDAPELQVGKMVNIKGAGEQDGKYLMMAVSHNIDSDGRYENQFEAIPAGVKSPPQVHDIQIPKCEIQNAFVEDNKDPDGLGRVQVRFLWQKSPEKSPWLRVISLHSGEDKGVYFIPEIGDEVLVGFENDHPERPFVVGSLYHGKAKPAEWQDNNNNKKAIKTKSGNQIFFSDESGKEEICIFNKDKSNEIRLTMESGGQIKIKAKDKLELAAKSILINADKEIIIKSSMGDIKIEGANLNLKSSAQLKIDGGALAEIKGAIIKLN